MKSTHYKSKSILDADGVPHEYRVTPRSAEAGIALLQKLSGLLPGLAPVILAASRGTAGVASAPIDLGGLSTTLAAAMDLELIKDVLRFAERDGKGVVPDFGRVYQSNYAELAEAVAFALSVDFGGVISAMGKQIARAQS